MVSTRRSGERRRGDRPLLMEDLADRSQCWFSSDPPRSVELGGSHRKAVAPVLVGDLRRDRSQEINRGSNGSGDRLRTDVGSAGVAHAGCAGPFIIEAAGAADASHAAASTGLSLSSVSESPAMVSFSASGTICQSHRCRSVETGMCAAFW